MKNIDDRRVNKNVRKLNKELQKDTYNKIYLLYEISCIV